MNQERSSSMLFVFPDEFIFAMRTCHVCRLVSCCQSGKHFAPSKQTSKQTSACLCPTHNREIQSKPFTLKIFCLDCTPLHPTHTTVISQNTQKYAKLTFGFQSVNKNMVPAPIRCRAFMVMFDSWRLWQ